jgi:hypothetical protein
VGIRFGLKFDWSNDNMMVLVCGRVCPASIPPPSEHNVEVSRLKEPSVKKAESSKIQKGGKLQDLKLKSFTLLES